MYRAKNLFSAAGPWSMAVQGTLLAIESQQVIAMRLMKMAMGGPDVQREAELMVSEKMNSAAEAGRMVVMAGVETLAGRTSSKPMLMRPQVFCGR